MLSRLLFYGCKAHREIFEKIVARAVDASAVVWVPALMRVLCVKCGGCGVPCVRVRVGREGQAGSKTWTRVARSSVCNLCSTSAPPSI